MTRLRYNFHRGTLADDIASGDTVLDSAELAGFPAIVSPDYAVLVLDPAAEGGDPEIVYVTAHSASGTTAAVTRGQEGTVARSHPATRQWLHTPTAADFDGLGELPVYPYPPEPWLAYSMDGASGAGETAVLGGFNLTQSGTVGTTDGVINTARSFVRASSQYLTVADAAGLEPDPGSPWWGAFWVRPTSIANAQNFVSKYEGGGNQRSWAIAQSSGGVTNQVEFRISPAGTGTGLGSVSTPARSLQADVWHLIVFYHDPATAQMGIMCKSVANGAQAFSTAAYSGVVFDGAAPFTIGKATSEGYADAAIDQVYLWKGSLPTLAWVDELFNEGNGLPHPFAPRNLEVTTPEQSRVFQRTGTTGDITITGTVNNAAASVEARWGGGSWTTIASSVLGAFSGSLTGETEGQETLEVRIVSDAASTRTIKNVGIGDVFIIAGQSNGSGRGSNNQAFTGAPLGSLYGNDYHWRQLVDPTDSSLNQADPVSDDRFINVGGAQGSVWPLVASSFVTSTGLPIAIVQACMGGTGIASWQPGADHQDRSTLYGAMVYRALQSGCKAVLWWQGETDSNHSMAEATYEAYLNTIVTAIDADLGVDTMACKLQTCSTTTWATLVNQQKLWDAVDDVWSGNAHALTGPDLSSVDVSNVVYGDGQVHVTTNAGLSACASLWWAALQAEFGYP